MTALARPVLYTPDLPAPPFRWTSQRKLALVDAVRRAPAHKAARLAAYGVSEEEFAAWERGWNDHGLDALKALKLQTLRRAARP